jgi:hypothetical protein
MLTDDDIFTLSQYHASYIDEETVQTITEPGSDDFLEAIQPILRQDSGMALLWAANKELRTAMLEPLTDIAQATYDNRVLLISDDETFGEENLARIPFPVLSQENPLEGFDAFMETVKGYNPRMVVVDDVDTPFKAFIAVGVAHVFLPRPNEVTVLAGVKGESSLEGVRTLMKLVESDPVFQLYDNRFFDEHGGGCGGDEYIVDVVLVSYIYGKSIPEDESGKILLEVASPYGDCKR